VLAQKHLVLEHLVKEIMAELPQGQAEVVEVVLVQ
jgi:hypothetical protein